MISIKEPSKRPSFSELEFGMRVSFFSICLLSVVVFFAVATNAQPTRLYMNAFPELLDNSENELTVEVSMKALNEVLRELLECRFKKLTRPGSKAKTGVSFSPWISNGDEMEINVEVFYQPRHMNKSNLLVCSFFMCKLKKLLFSEIHRLCWKVANSVSYE